MAVEIGQEAPDFTLKNRDNEEVSLSDFRGRNVVLIFFPLAFSAFCTAQFTSLAGNEQRYADSDAQVIAVSVDSRHAQREFGKSLGLENVLFLQDFEPKGAVARQYGAYMEGAGIAKRATFVIDKQGVVRSAVVNDPPDIPDEDAYFQTLSVCNT